MFSYEVELINTLLSSGKFFVKASFQEIAELQKQTTTPPPSRYLSQYMTSKNV